jgi:hypothetical protein
LDEGQRLPQLLNEVHRLIEERRMVGNFEVIGFF